MDPSVRQEIVGLSQLRIHELRAKYLALFGDATTANNKVWLVRRIAWRLQARAEGGLSERAMRRNAELARETDLRLIPPRLDSESLSPPNSPFSSTDHRLPPVLYNYSDERFGRGNLARNP